ncbi:Holliday junction branch migration DNA helicase RuvB [Candidatus Gracilibacteria bacterium]|nr:MAG: Holliday junction branch migration DNA helicase RuvB [Candidatus Gracilibacteria bacterium]PIE85301.1 MAG: Holliday junction branch migration DNA helicase RuvB [Candidatus Gracilibacteria bacterium]
MIKSAFENNSERIVSSSKTQMDKAASNTLRPKKLSEYVGQESIKKHLSVSISSAKIRGESIEHILFYGPPGLGKTTLSNIIASEMGTSLKSSSGPAIEKQSDLVSILSNLEKGDILFIDEIHRLRPQVEEILYTAMEDNEIDIMVGSGTGAQSVKLPLQDFTLVGATTKLSSLSSPLRDRFGNILKLDFYDINNLVLIAKRSAELLDLNIDKGVLQNIASRSRGTPRIVNRLLKVIRDYNTIGENISDEKVLNEIFKSIGIDELGLDLLDRKILEKMYYNFSGNPVGLNTLSASVGEEESTIEDVVEPYLLQIGFIERTPRGRKITISGEKHILKTI